MVDPVFRWNPPSESKLVFDPDAGDGVIMRFPMVIVCVLLTGVFTRNAFAGYGQQGAQTPVEQAEATAEAAQGRADDAGSRLAAVVNGLKTTFEALPEYAAAKKELTTATTREDTDEREILDQLHGTEEYQAAYKTFRDAHKAVEDAHANGDPDEIATAAMNAIKAKRAVEQMDTQALNGDTQYQADKKRFATASAVVRQLDLKFATSITSNPDWQKAKADKDKADAEAAGASATLAAVEAEYPSHTTQIQEGGGQHVK